jgi:hypothetical protein
VTAWDCLTGLGGTRPSSRSLERLCSGRKVPVVVIILLVGRAKFNCPDVTAARSYSWDIYPALPQLISPGTDRIVPRINRLAGREEGEMPLARRAIIGKGR